MKAKWGEIASTRHLDFECNIRVWHGYDDWCARVSIIGTSDVFETHGHATAQTASECAEDRVTGWMRWVRHEADNYEPEEGI